MNAFISSFFLIVAAIVSSANSEESCDPTPVDQACPELPEILKRFYVGSEAPPCLAEHMEKYAGEDEWTWQTVGKILSNAVQDFEDLKQNKDLMECVSKDREEYREKMLAAIHEEVGDDCKMFAVSLGGYIKSSFGCLFKD